MLPAPQVLRVSRAGEADLLAWGCRRGEGPSSNCCHLLSAPPFPPRPGLGEPRSSSAAWWETGLLPHPPGHPVSRALPRRVRSGGGGVIPPRLPHQLALRCDACDLEPTDASVWRGLEWRSQGSDLSGQEKAQLRSGNQEADFPGPGDQSWLSLGSTSWVCPED